jgi:hypothetical protein
MRSIYVAALFAATLILIVGFMAISGAFMVMSILGGLSGI